MNIEVGPEIAGKGFDIALYAGERTLIVNGLWSAEIEDALVEHCVDAVAFNYALGFRERNLEFLHSGLGIRRLSVLARTIKDLSPIIRLRDTLEVLSVEVDPRARLEVSMFPKLTGLGAAWSNLQESLSESASLQRLFLLSYDQVNLVPLAGMPLLTELTLKHDPCLRDLRGVKELRQLRSLSVFGASHLMNIDELANSNPDLELLKLATCKAIANVDPIGCMTNLQLLSIANDGPIESLRPLSGLKKLRTLYAYESTNVMDGDLSVLQGLPSLVDLRMQSRRHYRPSVEEVRDIIGRRAGGSDEVNY